MLRDGGPAFPQQSGISADGVCKFDTVGGMSLRDYLAGQAIAGIMANASGSTARLLDRAEIEGVSSVEVLARAAYKLSDALLIEKERPQP